MKRILRFLLGLSVVSPGVMPAAHAAEGADAAYIVTYIEVMPPAKDKALGLLRQFGKASRKDPGNVRFEVLQRIGTPSHFAILEAWADQKAQAAHGAAAHTREFREMLRPHLRAPYDERPHTALSVASGPAGAADGTKGAIYAVTHVDIVPRLKDEGAEAVKRLSEAGRKGNGNVRFEALQQTTRTNHMTVVEIWKNQKAVDEHGMAEHTKQFRDKLLPMSGSLYDERFYKVLN